ncbi:MAG: ECF transporter S component [Chlamydiae bacterium]|nr:ECF transporter S component [Chlamydiota bacterium]
MDLSPVITPIPSGRAYESQEAQRLQTFSACYELARRTHGVLPSLFHAYKAANANKALVVGSTADPRTLYDQVQTAQRAREAETLQTWTQVEVLEKLHQLQTDLYYLRAPAVCMMQKHLKKIEDLKVQILTLEAREEELQIRAKNEKAHIKYPAMAQLQKIPAVLQAKKEELKELLNYEKVKAAYEASFDLSLAKRKLEEFKTISPYLTGGAEPPEVVETLDTFMFRSPETIADDLQYAEGERSETLKALFTEELSQHTAVLWQDPIEDLPVALPRTRDQLETPRPIQYALYQSPDPHEGSLGLRSFTYVRRTDLPLDPTAPEKSVLRQSLANKNIFTQIALFIHKLCKDHSIFFKGDWKKDSYFVDNGGSGLADLFARVHRGGFVGTEGMVRKLGFVISDLFLHLTLFFDKHGYSSKDEIVSRFVALKKSHGALKGGVLAILEGFYKTLSTLISMGLSVGALTLEGVFFLLSKASAAIVGSIVYLLTIEKIWLAGLVVGTVIGGVALHAVNLAVIILLMIPYGILRYRARKKEAPDFMHLTLDQRNGHILGLSSSRHPPLHYSLNPLEFYTNKENQTAFLDTFTRRPIDERDGFHQSPTEKFLASCTDEELKQKCEAYEVTQAGFSPTVDQEFNRFVETNRWTKRETIIKNLHYFRLELCSHLCRYDRIRKDRLIDLLNKGDIHLLHLYLQCIGRETPGTRINDDDLRLIQGAAQGVFN